MASSLGRATIQPTTPTHNSVNPGVFRNKPCGKLRVRVVESNALQRNSSVAQQIMPSQQSWRTPTSHFDGTYTRDTLGASSRAPAAISDTTDEHCAVVTVSPSEQEVRTRWSMVQFAAGGTETASAAQQVTTIAAVAATYTKLVGMLVMQARGWPRVGTDAWCGTLEDRAPAVGGGEQPQVFCSWQSQAPVF